MGLGVEKSPMTMEYSAAAVFGFGIGTKNRIDVPTTPHQWPSSGEQRCVDGW